MQTSAFEYKCRRCGEVWEEQRGQAGHVETRFRFRPNRFTFSENDTHACPDKGHGISDLIGITPPREKGE